MTVGELIERLSEFDPEALVWAEDGEELWAVEDLDEDPDNGDVILELE